jgi:hypothetical protein
MNKLILFAGQDYYPQGGVKDFVAFFESIEEFRESRWYADKTCMVYGETIDWWQLVDVFTMQSVAEGGEGVFGIGDPEDKPDIQEDYFWRNGKELGELIDFWHDRYGGTAPLNAILGLDETRYKYFVKHPPKEDMDRDGYIKYLDSIIK